MPINFRVDGLKGVGFGMVEFGKQFTAVATRAAAVYLVGDSSRGLKHEPAYRYVSRKSAYGQTFSSDRQRRYVMAMIRKGVITPGVQNRTHAIQNGWGIASGAKDTRITNDAPGVGWVMGQRQARQPGLAGWRRYPDVITTNTTGMSRASTQAVQALARQLIARGAR